MTPSDTVYESEENEPFDMVQLSSQGAAAGAVLGFIMPIAGMLSNPQNGYNFLYQLVLPAFLAGGMLFGALEGIILWSCMHSLGHRLNLPVRTAFAIVGMVIILVALNLLAQPSPYEPKGTGTEYLFKYGCYAIYGLLFGLVTGTSFQPLRALVSEATDYKYQVLSVITGFALRVIVIFGLMESVLYLIWTEQRNLDDAWWTFGVFSYIHFIAATVIAFGRMPFGHLATVAFITNLPIIVFIFNTFKDHEQALAGAIGLAYLGLWAAFVLSRLPDRQGEEL